MRRAFSFVRSILPRDLMQLVFLLGSFFLYVSALLRWWPKEWAGRVGHLGPIIFWGEQSAVGYALAKWLHFVWWGQVLVFVSGCAGVFLWLCFTRNSVRNVLLCVCTPACSAIVVICARFLYLAWKMQRPLLDISAGRTHFVPWTWAVLSELGPGLRFAALGILLIGFFLSRLWFGLTSLPATLPKSSIVSADDYEWSSQMWIMVWFSMTCAAITYGLGDAPFYLFVVHLHTQVIPLGSRSAWLFALSTAAGGVIFASIVAWAVGRSRWDELRRFLRAPTSKYLGVAFLMAVSYWAFLLVCAYIPERITFLRGEPVFVEFSSFWLTNQLRQLHSVYVVIFLMAFLEEIVFRGYLQPRFIRRYGISRGLCILGLAWGAYHFYWDFNPRLTDGRIIFDAAQREVFCVLSALILGWLALRSGSIWPSTVVHGAFNFYLEAFPDFHPPLRVLCSLVFELCLAYLLFRYWRPTCVADASGVQIT